MTDDLRQRLQSAAGSPSTGADIGAIASRAAHLRRRRRLALASGAAALVVAAVLGGAVVLNQGGASRRSTRVATGPHLTTTGPTTTASPTTTLVPADAAAPAAGGCGGATRPTVLITLSPDVPQPRCVRVLGGQRLEVANPTAKSLTVSLGTQSVTVAPGGSATLEKPFGADLANGVHRVKVDNLYAGSGPEVWLQDAASSNIPNETLAAYLSQRFDVLTRTEPVALTPAGPTVAVIGLRDNPTHQTVLVLQMSDDGSWATAAQLAEQDPYFGVGNYAIDSADVTGDGRRDFLVLTPGGSTILGMVVSDDGGRWRLLHDQWDGIYMGRDPRFIADHLVTTYNDCTPNCAEGHNTDYTWTYDRRAGHFTSNSPKP
jgi:hypothetical protein